MYIDIPSKYYLYGERKRFRSGRYARHQNDGRPRINRKTEMIPYHNTSVDRMPAFIIYIYAYNNNSRYRDFKTTIAYRFMYLNYLSTLNYGKLCDIYRENVVGALMINCKLFGEKVIKLINVFN